MTRKAARSVAKSHFAGAVRRQVGLGRARIQRGLDFARRPNDQLGVQQATVAGSAATCSDRDLDLVGQVASNLPECRGQKLPALRGLKAPPGPVMTQGRCAPN